MVEPLSQTQNDFPSLLSIVQAAIKDRYRSFLSDIGSIEVALLEDALAACSSEELEHIEDSTLHGVFKRDLSAYTWPLWYTHCIQHDSHGFFASLKSMPPLPPPVNDTCHGHPLGLSLVDNIAPANYRLVYQQVMKHREDKLGKLGQRLKDMRAQEEKKKASRSIQVIESRLDRRGRPLPTLQKPGAALGAGAPFAKSNQPPSKQHSVKERIMKKLNVSAPDLKLNSKRAMLDSKHKTSHTLHGRGGGSGSIGSKTKPAARQLPTQAVLAGRVKVKSRAELVKEEAERKVNRLKAASILNDDDIFAARNFLRKGGR